MIDFQVFSPIGILLKTSVKKIDFEGIEGFHTLLPRHIDCVDAIKAGIVTYTDENGKELYIACNQGIIVKKGTTVTLSTPLAVFDNSLDTLSKTIAKDFKQMEEERKEVNLTLAQLEVGLIKGMRALKDGGNHAGL